MSTITLTAEMQSAIDVIENSNDHVFITGKAGTGKTTLLHYIVNNCKKKVIVAASTGIAAVNAGGVTLHSLLQIPIGCLTSRTSLGSMNKANEKVLKHTQAIIIDEVSMVRPDVMDFVDRKLRKITGVRKPFGGVQLIMFGDLHQLPPVIKAEEKKVLEGLYGGEFFFNANVFRTEPFKVVQLREIFRQRDPVFVEILNNVRNCTMTLQDHIELGARYKQDAASDFSSGAIHLCTHRADAANINKQMLGKATHQSKAVFKGKFNENSAPCDLDLSIRVGVRVMTLTNDWEEGYVNGSLGYVTKIGGTKTKIKYVKVRLDSGDIVEITPHKWEAVEYVMDEEGELKQTTVGTCTQLPLTLAWAITIHKSQGLTFDKAIVHIRKAFAPGQVYVALSRCRTLDGLTMDSAVSRRSVMNNQELQKFEEFLANNNNVYMGKSEF